jgi:hypothetical protein
MDREIYFEHTVVGRHAKVTAIDSVTHLEVSVFGPSSANPRDLEALALRKLRVRLDREGGAAPAGTPGGGGRLA